MLANAVGFERILEVAFAGRFERNESASRAVADMIAEIGEREPRRVFEELARRAAKT
jgi:hypothetical protein